YSEVDRLKRERPELEIVINGGILSLDQALDHLERVDGAMIGRAAYQDPWCLAEADRRLFGETAPAPSRLEVVERLLPYLEAECAGGTPLKAMTRHILGLFNGLPGARAWRRHLSEAAHRPAAGPEVVEQALAELNRRGAALAA